MASHKSASNAVINAEGKTEQEITILSKEYADLAEQVKEVKDEKKEIEKIEEKGKKLYI